MISMRYFIEIRVVHRHMGEQFAVVGIIGDFRIPRLLHDLLNTHTVVIVLERYTRTFRAHLLQLAASLPCVRPRPIIGRIANRIVGNRLAVVTGQLVLPVEIAIDVGDRFNRRAHRTRGVGVLDLGSDVPSAVVVVNPRCILIPAVEMFLRNHQDSHVLNVRILMI